MLQEELEAEMEALEGSSKALQRELESAELMSQLRKGCSFEMRALDVEGASALGGYLGTLAELIESALKDGLIAKFPICLL